MKLKIISAKLLTFIESCEIRLLGWGFYDVSFSFHELEQLLETEGPEDLLQDLNDLYEDGQSISTVVSEMIAGGLLFAVDDERFRSRFAEGVRLIASLRQMFKDADWQNGARLVSDIKMQINPRRYPKRVIGIDDCWAEMKSATWSMGLQKAAFEELAEKGIEELKFARFQVSAFSNVLSNYRGKGLSGTIVTAGTGSGKTKAFFIPAFLSVITELEIPTPFTKVLATYPRNVLLADQLREALSEASKLESVCNRNGLRFITFGALLGTTPSEHWFQQHNGRFIAEQYGWKRVGDGFIIPFLKSPSSPDKDLIWRDEDRHRGSTALYRSDLLSGEPEIKDGVLVLMREKLRTTPPDVLFLSLEMLNREMGNPDWGATFGFNQTDRKPRFLLLDELHAYEGMHGAQIAWVLRRWRYWSKIKNLHVIGLSATLKDAGEHLARLTGIPSFAINEFTPSLADLTQQDAEYNLVVKGDAGSGTSLLSTSIQTCMLVTRLLTPAHVPGADRDQVAGSNFYGRKVFGFTDNLDSLNRWFSDMSDAERKRLARLRLNPLKRQPVQRVTTTILAAMNSLGQIWDLPYRLGHNLMQGLRVSRCSSQDPGANVGSDIIVASASLEVGFDDPEVGAVIHHKRPISMASFIQRKGRAGRRIGSRPWTVTLLSEYGADKWAFQNAERLFQPEINRLQLPITNPFVLKTQAAYFLIDWLGHRINDGGPFSYLANQGKIFQQSKAIEILKDFLLQGPQWKAFKHSFLKVFAKPGGDLKLQLKDSEIDSLIWDEPRPLLVGAVPTLLRKLEKRWKYADPLRAGEIEDNKINRPIPSYLPAATFSGVGGFDTELLFPETEEKAPEVLSVFRAINEACPGRVSKRYSLRVNENGYWLPFSANLINSEWLTIVGTKDLYRDRIMVGTVGDTVVFQPMSLELAHRDDIVLDTSNGHWNWKFNVTTNTDGKIVPLALRRPWSKLIKRTVSHLHRNNAHLEVTRYATDSSFELRYQTGGGNRGTLKLGSVRDDGNLQEEAVGFRMDADGVVVELSKDFVNEVKDVNSNRQSRFRPDYFLHRLLTCETLTPIINNFMIEWVWQIDMAMLAATALANRCSLQDAQEKLSGKRPKVANAVMDRILRVGDGEGEDESSKLKDRLLEVWKNGIVISRIEELERVLWDELDGEYDEWIRERLVYTVAQGLRLATTYHCGDLGDDEINVDVDRNEQSVNVCLSEAGPGGLGQIETLTSNIQKSPHVFDETLRHAVTECRRGTMERNLLEIVEQAVKYGANNDVARAFGNVRNAKGYDGLTRAKDNLTNVLQSAGLDSSRDTIVALQTRILRPGSTGDTDLLVHFLNKAWRRKETKLSVSIDPKAFAYVCAQFVPLRRRLTAILRSLGGNQSPSESQVLTMVEQLLFPICTDSCPECLGGSKSYNSNVRPSRDLVTEVLEFRDEVLELSSADEDWMKSVRQLLLIHNRVLVVFDNTLRAPAVRFLQKLLVEEVEIGFNFVPISISGVKRRHGKWEVLVELRNTGYFSVGQI